ncbi:hypothetical protein TNCV_981781 [Trichonephila clavipes]|nr:hypothetical protein TNCV_981781 [Trichonephila clavipes]
MHHNSISRLPRTCGAMSKQVPNVLQGKGVFDRQNLVTSMLLKLKTNNSTDLYFVAVEIFVERPTSVSWGKLPTKTTQPTSRIGALTSTLAELKEDTYTKDSFTADQR